VLCGGMRMARVVGWALHINPTPIIVPCHRVVNKEGRLARNFGFGGESAQRELLLKEGVQFEDDGRVKREYFLK